MAAPVRGTQTFVGVMTSVWSRPSVTALEIAWRWLAGTIVLALGCAAFGGVAKLDVDTTGLQAMTVFQPVAAFATVRVFAGSVWPHAAAGMRWFVPAACAIWLTMAAFGRTLTLRRSDPSLAAKPLPLLLLGALRAGLLGGFWLVWVVLLRWAAQLAILGPAVTNRQPNLVLFAAIAICGTLLLYVLWGIVSWPFYLAPLLAMLQRKGALSSLRAAFGSGAVSGKLMEINLVMNIVKLALIVLAMVFSASPLPFTSVATQTFLACWWTGVLLLYFAMSDYFHVVRAAAYLRLWQAYKKPAAI